MLLVAVLVLLAIVMVRLWVGVAAAVVEAAQAVVKILQVTSLLMAAAKDVVESINSTSPQRPHLLRGLNPFTSTVSGRRLVVAPVRIAAATRISTTHLPPRNVFRRKVVLLRVAAAVVEAARNQHPRRNLHRRNLAPVETPVAGVVVAVTRRLLSCLPSIACSVTVDLRSRSFRYFWIPCCVMARHRNRAAFCC